MKYTDKEVASYTVNGEERVVVERTFTDGTIHHHFVRESSCEHCERGRIYINDTLYFCEDCDGRGHASEEVPCDVAGNDEDSPFYLPYVNGKAAKSDGITDDDWDRLTFDADTAMPNQSERCFPDPNDFAMDSFG